jgi:hypothetical protein
MKKGHAELVQEWSEKIQKQIASGKSVAAWCREESIPYNTFLYWHKRLQKTNSPEDQVKRSSFVECPQDSEVWIEILLEGAKLTLSRNFNRASLLFCLRVFGGH